MSIVEWFNRQKLIRYDRLLGLYPLFFIIGAKIRFSDNYKTIKLKLPLRWYNKNNNGVLFGGVISLLSDPFPALIFEKLIIGSSAWTRNLFVNYLIPAKSSVEATIIITDADIADLNQQLNEKGKAEKKFEYYFTDNKGRNVAHVCNTTYLRKKQR